MKFLANFQDVQILEMITKSILTIINERIEVDHLKDLVKNKIQIKKFDLNQAQMVLVTVKNKVFKRRSFITKKVERVYP